MPTCGNCGAKLERCPMGCGELRCPDVCDGQDEVDHEREHKDSDDMEYQRRLDELDEEFGR